MSAPASAISIRCGAAAGPCGLPHADVAKGDGELKRLYVLASLLRGQVPHAFVPAMRLLNFVTRWGMVEVFLLGMLVSLVKLSHLATVILGTAFWATAALILALTFAGRAFDTRLLWQTPLPDEAEDILVTSR